MDLEFPNSVLTYLPLGQTLSIIGVSSPTTLSASRYPLVSLRPTFLPSSLSSTQRRVVALRHLIHKTTTGARSLLLVLVVLSSPCRCFFRLSRLLTNVAVLFLSYSYPLPLLPCTILRPCYLRLVIVVPAVCCHEGWKLALRIIVYVHMRQTRSALPLLVPHRKLSIRGSYKSHHIIAGALCNRITADTRDLGINILYHPVDSLRRH